MLPSVRHNKQNNINDCKSGKVFNSILRNQTEKPIKNVAKYFTRNSNFKLFWMCAKCPPNYYSPNYLNLINNNFRWSIKQNEIRFDSYIQWF